MDTIKTAAVVALLLAVLYGIYVVLNREEPPPPPEVAEMMKELDDNHLLQPPAVESGTTTSPGAASNSAASQVVPTGATSSKPGDTNQPRIFVQVQSPDESSPSAPQLPPTAPTIASSAPPRTEPITPPPDASNVQPPVKMPPAEETADSSPPSSYRTAGIATTHGGTGDGPSAAGGSKGLPSAGSNVAKPDTSSNLAWQSGDRFSSAGEGRDATGGLPSSYGRWENPPLPPSVGSQPTTGTGPISSSNSSEVSSSGSAGYATGSSSAAENTTGHDKFAVRPGAAGSAKGTVPSLSAAVQEAKSLIDARKYREALETLSIAYSAHQATADAADRQAALDLLDPLAAAVIYSRQHWLEPAHRVKVGESLEDIAAAYQVPWQLLRNINGIADPQSLVPGSELKVLRGPFRAVVELTRSELTLYLHQMYAGRFPIAVGSDPSPPPGEYLVLNKQEGRTYYAADGRTVPPYDPQNPYGGVWIDLGVNGVCIHGSPRASGPGISTGCISLSPKDATDVWAILSVGSRVSIRP